MATNTVQLLSAMRSTGASNAVRMRFGPKVFQINQTSNPTATVRIQGSVDGATWDDLYTHTTSGTAQRKVVEVAASYPLFRVNVTAYTAGSIDAHVAGELDV